MWQKRYEIFHIDCREEFVYHPYLSSLGVLLFAERSYKKLQPLEPDTVSTGVGKVVFVCKSFIPFFFSVDTICAVQDNTINVLFFGDVMKINLNGKLVETHCRSLMDLVEEQGLNPTSLIAEYNFEVVKQELWSHLHIKDKDNIELLSFVGGG